MKTNQALESVKEPKPIVPVLAGVIFNPQGKVLLTRRHPRLSNGGRWEFPGGKLRPGEQPRDCLRRELQEELGIEVTVYDPVDVVTHGYEHQCIVLIAYRCRYLGGDIRLIDHDRYLWVDPGEVLQFELSAADVPIARKLVQETARPDGDKP